MEIPFGQHWTDQWPGVTGTGDPSLFLVSACSEQEESQETRAFQVRKATLYREFTHPTSFGMLEMQSDPRERGKSQVPGPPR